MGSNGGYIGYDATPKGDGKAPGVWGLRDVYLARLRGTWPVEYALAVAHDAPLVWLKLDETSGTTAADASGNGNNGTYNGGYTLAATPVVNDGLYAVTFDGSTGYVSLSALGTLTSWTLEAWGIFNSVSGEQTAISNDMAGWNDDVLFGLHPESTGGTTAGRIGVVHHDATDSVRTRVQAGTAAVVGARYHMVATSDGAALRLYINGPLAAMAPRAGAALKFGNNPVNIGRNPTYGRYINARLDHVAIYGHPLSAERVQAHYNAGIAQ